MTAWTFTFEYPWVLVALAAAGVGFFRPWYFRPQLFHPQHRTLSLLALSLLVMGLSGPSLLRHTTSPDIIVLLDLSPSTREAPWRNPLWLQKQLQAHLAAPTRVKLEGLDTRRFPIAELRLDGPWPRFWPQEPPLPAPMPPSQAPRWFFTDGAGDFSDGVSSPWALTLWEHPGVGICRLEQTGSVLQATLQASVGHQPIPMTCQWRRNGQLVGQESRLLNCSGRTLLLSPPLAQPAQWELQLTSPAGSQHARWRYMPPRAGKVLRIPSELYAAPQAPADLTPWDQVILQEVERKQLPPGWEDRLENWVEQGGHLVLLGGERVFGPGGYLGPDSAIARLSPLRATPLENPRKLLVLLDASGSMATPGETLSSRFDEALSALERALKLLPSNQPVEVLAFQNQPVTLAQGPAGRVAGELRKTPIQPSGPTVPDRILRPDFGSGLVVLLTDGQIPKLDQARWRQALQHADWVVLAPAQEPNSPLEELCRSRPTRRFTTGDSRQWALTLSHALLESVSGQARYSPLTWLPMQPPEKPETLPMTHWIETFLAPRSTLWAQSDAGWPLAAQRHQGLGRVSAVSFSSASPGYHRLIEQLVQSPANRPSEGEFQLELERLRASWKVVVRARNQGRALNGLHLGLQGWDEPKPRVLEQQGPGLYVLEVADASVAWPAQVQLIEEKGDERILRGQAGIPELPSGEDPAFWPLEPAWAASATRIAPESTEIWSPQIVETWPLWPALALAAAAVLILAMRPKRV